jgi:hypothetical protein
MKGHAVATYSLLAISALIVLGAVIVLRTLADAEPVFPVAVVDAGLSQHPGAWVGRTIRAEGAIFGTWCDVTAPCAHTDGDAESSFTIAGGDRFVLVSAQDPPPHQYDVRQPSLLLALGPPDVLVATLRSLPLLGKLGPAP